MRSPRIVLAFQGKRIEKSKYGVFVTRYIYDQGIRIAGETNEMGTELSHYVWGTKVNVPEYIVKGGQRYDLITDY